MLSAAVKNQKDNFNSPLRNPGKMVQQNSDKPSAETAANTKPEKKTVKIEEPINSDEEQPINNEDLLAQIPVSRLVTELFRNIAIDESDVRKMLFQK